jgi:hypothetical protein
MVEYVGSESVYAGAVWSVHTVVGGMEGTVVGAGASEHGGGGGRGGEEGVEESYGEGDLVGGEGSVGYGDFWEDGVVGEGWLMREVDVWGGLWWLRRFA